VEAPGELAPVIPEADATAEAIRDLADGSKAGRKITCLRRITSCFMLKHAFGMTRTG
jgi:hypothetical protein